MSDRTNPIDANSTNDSADPIADYLARIALHLTTDDQQREAILAEVRCHLEEAAAHAVATGADPGQAATQAVMVFGSASTVAHRFNAVHPIAWSPMRFVRGAAWGVVVTWLVWTLVTYPVLAYLTVTRGAVPGNLPGVFHPLWLDLLFYASPPAFGAIWALGAVPALWLVPFILLYSAVPFVWGMRARRWWVAGLAFGLGGVLAFPWVLATIPYRWNDGNNAWLLVVVAAYWLLMPIAVAASGVGAFAATWLPSLGAILRRRPTVARRWRVLSARSLAGAALLVLLGLSVWAGVSAATWAPAAQPAPAQQIAAIQAHLNFPVALPTALPPGMRLTAATKTMVACAAPCGPNDDNGIALSFTNASGEWLELSERLPSPADTITAPTATGTYQFSQATGGEARPVWWLGEDTSDWTETSLIWTGNGVEYQLVTTSHLTQDQLQAIATSLR